MASQGVVVGFLTAICYNIWIMVGKFLGGGGSPKRLALSTEGCPENLLLQLANSTVTTASSLPDDLVGTAIFPDDLQNTTLPGEKMMVSIE